MRRLAIGGPTRDLVPAAFAVDVAQLYAKTKESRIWATVTIGFVASTYIHAGREWFLESVRKQGATHVLWLDTDMSFPAEAAIRLHRHDQPIVGCNYRVRQESGLFTARRNQERVITDENSTGLEAVDELGFGVVLMRMDILSRLHRPWFRHGLNPQGGDIGEDIMFCRSLRDVGYTIYLDHDLSKEVGHIGQHTFHTIPKREPVAV